MPSLVCRNRMAYLTSDAGACLGMPWHSEGQGWHTGQHRVKKCICQPYPALHKELNGEGTEGDCKFFAGNINSLPKLTLYCLVGHICDAAPKFLFLFKKVDENSLSLAMSENLRKKEFRQ